MTMHGHHAWSPAALAERFARHHQRLVGYIRQLVANMVQVHPITMTTATGKAEGVEERPAAGFTSDEGQSVPVGQTQRGVRRFQHAGFRSRPPSQSQAVCLLLEGGATKVVVVAEDDGVSVSIEEGESAHYSSAEPTCIIKCSKVGKITIDAATGQDVQVNGGTHKVARADDALNVGTLSGTAGPWPVLFTYTPGVPPAGVPVVQAGQSVHLAGIVDDATGAPNFKA